VLTDLQLLHRMALPLAVAFLVTAVATPVMIGVAHRLGWVARPRADRWHSRPTALSGGIALFAGTLAGWAAVGSVGQLDAIALPAIAMFLLGLVDDRLRLRPHVKFIGQVAAVAALILGGVRFQALPSVIALPLTFVWVIGITNAINLLDNMDGLAAGVSAISAVTMAIFSLTQGSGEMAATSLALAGACAAFLIYNFQPARIFMGDCGSMFLGFSLASLAVLGTYRSAPNLALSLFVPVAILAVPIFDTALVSIVRTLHGRPISLGGRDHSSHRLVALGLSERSTVLLFYGLSALFGALALATVRLPLLTVGLVAAVLSLVLVALGIYLGLIRVYPAGQDPPARVLVLRGALLGKKQLLQVMIDAVLVPIALVGAHLLRFEGELPATLRARIVEVLPLVLAAKLIGLGVCRAHRGVWRYAGMGDVLAAGAGSLAGSVLSVGAVALFLGLEGHSRVVWIIDFILFTVLTIAARTGYLALHHLFSLLAPRQGPRVLILGIGPECLALIRRLRDPLEGDRACIVGILSDDRSAHRRALNGVPVLGSLADLVDVVREAAPVRCVLGVSPSSAEGKRIRRHCQQNGIDLALDLDEVLGDPADEAAPYVWSPGRHGRLG